MRKPRVIVIDDEMCILDMLKIFLSRRGFEVIVFSTPTMCSVYERTSDECFRTLKCADILITDMTMPNMAGADLVELQQRKGCMITSQNKAVISGNVDERQKERICTIGSVVFSKPFRLAEIDGWLQECETRIDLEEPLERFERRKECRRTIEEEVRFSVLTDPLNVISGTILNRSGSGFCMEATGAIYPGINVLIRNGSKDSTSSAMVRWVSEKKGAFVAGFINT